MDTASFVAALIGPLYVVVGIGILLDPNHYSKMTEEFFAAQPLFIWAEHWPSLPVCQFSISIIHGAAIGGSLLQFLGGWPVSRAHIFLSFQGTSPSFGRP